MKKYIAFARVSSQVQRDEGYSLEVQMGRMNEYAKKQDGTIIKHWEVAETASKAKARKEFMAMVAYAKLHHAELSGILFDRLDRATRNRKDSAVIEALHEDFGITSFFVTEGLDTSPERGIEFAVRSAFAQHTVFQLARKAQDAVAQRVKEGLFPGKAPFGYVNYRQNRRGFIRVNEAAAATVGLIFDLYARRGHTLDMIVERLRDDGVHVGRSIKANRSTVYAILQNRSYIGEVFYRDQWHPGSQTPLVSTAVFNSVQKLLGGHIYQAHDLLFGGQLVTCAKCAHPMTGYPATKYKGTPRQDLFTYYVCAHCARNGVSVKAKQPELERQVLAVFERMRTDDPEVVEWFRRTIREMADDEHIETAARAADLRQRLTKAETRDRSLTRMRMDGEITPEDYACSRNELRTERLRLNEELSVAERHGDEKTDLAIRTFELARCLEKRWISADRPEKRNLLNIICSNLRWDGISLVLEMRKPFDLLVERPLVSFGRTDRI